MVSVTRWVKENQVQIDTWPILPSFDRKVGKQKNPICKMGTLTLWMATLQNHSLHSFYQSKTSTCENIRGEVWHKSGLQKNTFTWWHPREVPTIQTSKLKLTFGGLPCSVLVSKLFTNMANCILHYTQWDPNIIKIPICRIITTPYHVKWIHIIQTSQRVRCFYSPKMIKGK